jgi:glucose-1-phosphate thymidylyltransferase
VANPTNYGILETNQDGKPISITEKPTEFISNLAVTGVYFFDGKVSEISKNVQPSKRGELEITSVIEHYLNSGSLTFTRLSRGAAWLDTGNPDSLSDAAAYVRIIEDRTGHKIACLEEIAFNSGWLSQQQLYEISHKFKNNYGAYLRGLLN